MEWTGTFISLTCTFAEWSRSAPPIRDSNSRPVGASVQITSEHQAKVQLPQLARFLPLELRQIPHTGHEASKGCAAAAISRDPNHCQTLSDAITSHSGQGVITHPLTPGELILELNRDTLKQVLQALKAEAAQCAAPAQIIEKSLVIRPALHQLRPERLLTGKSQPADQELT